MAINKISEFPKVTPSADDKILIEKNGEGGHINLSEMPVSTPVNTKISSEVSKLTTRLDNLVLNAGDSSAECADARVNADESITYSSLKARLDAENNQLKGDLDNLSGAGILKFDPSMFVNGDFNNTGAINTTNKFRVANLTLMTFNYPTKVTVADGYAIFVFYYDSEVFDYRDANILGEYTIPANKQFRIFIKANPEDTSIVANINQFVGALSIETVVSDNMKAVSMSPCIAQVPPLFEGGYHATGGQVYHDTNETWVKTRVRTNIVYVKAGAVLKTSATNYQLTVCRYANFEAQNYIETLLNQSTAQKWKCSSDGYYTITFKLTSGDYLDIDTVKSDFDFSGFYCQRDERIHISWIGSGISAETSTYTDSGDCAMVVFPNGEGLLIDSANSRNCYSVRKRLAESGFYHIKNIIISHFHADHVGGLLTMVNDNLIKIDGATVYLPDYDATLWAYNNNVMDSATKTLYDNAITMFANKNCNLVYPDTDFKPYEIGGAVLSFFNTDMSVYEGVSTNYNDWSLGNYIFYGNINICFSADLGPIAQSQVGGTLYKSNIYKADHHGWLNQTSIPSNYINNVSPDVIIAMDGQVHDSYLGTDTAPLVKWADKNGIAYYRKYTNGEIKMAVSKEAWKFESKVTRYELPNA